MVASTTFNRVTKLEKASGSGSKIIGVCIPEDYDFEETLDRLLKENGQTLNEQDRLVVVNRGRNTQAHEPRFLWVHSTLGKRQLCFINQKSESSAP